MKNWKVKNLALFNLFKSFSQKEIDENNKIVKKILALDEDMQKLTDEQLREKTSEFKKRLADGETLDDLLPEALFWFLLV